MFSKYHFLNRLSLLFSAAIAIIEAYRALNHSGPDAFFILSSIPALSQASFGNEIVKSMPMLFPFYLIWNSGMLISLLMPQAVLTLTLILAFKLRQNFRALLISVLTELILLGTLHMQPGMFVLAVIFTLISAFLGWVSATLQEVTFISGIMVLLWGLFYGMPAVALPLFILSFRRYRIGKFTGRIFDH